MAYENISSAANSTIDLIGDDAGYRMVSEISVVGTNPKMIALLAAHDAGNYQATLDSVKAQFQNTTPVRDAGESLTLPA